MIDGIPNRPLYFHQKDIIGITAILPGLFCIKTILYSIFLLTLDHKVMAIFFRHNQGPEAGDSEDVFIEKNQVVGLRAGIAHHGFLGGFFLCHRGLK